MKELYLLILLAFIGFTANAQFNYSFSNSKILNKNYTDIAATGTAIPMSNLENGSSTVPQNIGFDFSFNGTVFTQFMIHADGILKFGTVAPGISTGIAPSPNSTYASVFTTNTTAYQNVLLPFFLDLVQGTASPEFHILTTGTAPNRVTTVQWKNLRDADNPASTLQHQFANLEFQVKLYETSNNIEMVYGTWVASTNAPLKRFSAMGIKASGTDFISYTRFTSLISFDKGNFEDPASTNSRIFYVEKAVAPAPGTTFIYYSRLTNDVNVAKLYVDDAVPQKVSISKNIQALIKNEGTADAANIPVTLTLGGVNNNTETINIPALAAGASQLINFSPQTVTNIGLQTVNISVNAAADDRPENNSLQTTQRVSENVLRLFSDDKKASTGFGFNGTSGRSATKIYGVGTRNLSQVKVSFNIYHALVDVSIFEDNGVDGAPGALIYQSPSFKVNIMNEVVVPLPTELTVTDDYYVVVTQRETTTMALRFFNQYPRIPGKGYTGYLNTNSWAEDVSSFTPLITVVEESIKVDVGFEHLTAPGCSQSNDEIVKATIRNFSSQVHDYAVNPVTVSGRILDEVTNSSVPFSFVINSGTIAAGGRDTITLLNSLNFTSRGNYLFLAKTNCTADLEPGNDSLNFSIYTKIGFMGIPVDSICPNTATALSIVAPNLIAPLYFNGSSAGNLPSFGINISVSPNATTTYYATGQDYRGCTITDSLIVKVKSIGVPVAPIIATADSVQSYKNDFTAVLTAPPLAGHTITWVSDATGGVASPDRTSFSVSPVNAIGTSNTNKAFYTRSGDGCSSVFSNVITTSFAPGLLINENVSVVSDTSFYDNGGPENPSTNSDFINTYSPADASKKLKLTINKFDLGQFGFIRIFDGADNSAPQIGILNRQTAVAPKYEFTASNPGGKLTIDFSVSGNTDNGFLGSLTSQSAFQFRTIANGTFNDPLIWESRPLGSSNFTAATRLPNKGDDSIWVRHNVSINKTIPLDQVLVETSGNLEVTGNGTFLNMYKTIPGNELTIKGSVTTNAGTFVGANSTNILLMGTLINNTAMQTDSVKVFENNVPAIISGNGKIDKLIVNSSKGIQINGNVEIRRELSLLNGIVKINPANYINLISGDGPVIVGGNANSYVDGKLRRQMFRTYDPFIFPLGTNGMYRPISLFTNQNSEDFAVEYEATMIAGAAPARTLPATLSSLNSRYYHNVTITAGSSIFGDAQITIHYEASDGVTNAANLRIAKDDGGSGWDNIGGSGTANGAGSITSDVFYNFSDFVLATTTGALPLKLISFKGSAHQNYNQLNWETGNQINTDYFIVEKSTDGLSFLVIGKVPARQTLNANYEFKDADLFATGSMGIVFYRLKMIDRDRKYEYSNILKIDNAGTTKLSIYPNPVINKLSIVTDKKDDAVITNSLGQTVKIINLLKGITNVDVSTWAKGLYYIKTENGMISFIKQ